MRAAIRCPAATPACWNRPLRRGARGYQRDAGDYYYAHYDPNTGKNKSGDIYTLFHEPQLEGSYDSVQPY